MPYIERDGVKVYYESEGSGPAVLLSHGYSATSAMWMRCSPACSPRRGGSRTAPNHVQFSGRNSS